MSKATFDPTLYNSSDNTPFATVLERHIHRRTLIRTGSAMAALSIMASLGLSGCDSNSDKHRSSGAGSPVTLPDAEKPLTALGFQSIPGSRTDAIVVPENYKASILAPWGTPLNDRAAPWKPDGTNTAEDQANSVGMHHDGMSFYPLNGSHEDGLLCINHEYIDQDALHPNGVTRDATTRRRILADEVRKEIYAHGVTVVRIKKVEGVWQVVANDRHNRRITGATEMDISGPMAGHDLLKTPFSPDGISARGTFNNCGNGTSPWGTFLTCEENWPGYFANTAERTADQARIGLGTTGNQYGWNDLAGNESEKNDEFARFDVTPRAESALLDYRNEANGHGYIVEIDPYSPDSRPIKRTALGRFRHEACEVGKLAAGRPVAFYSGHDAQGEYVYKFVSSALWDPADAKREDRLAVGDKYLNEGTLYVARFDEDGTGVWLPLTLESLAKDGKPLSESFESLADIILNTAGAADLLGATPMDRPEWGAVDPITGSVYMTLTNNTARREANAANPRVNNKFGHIIRWDESEDHRSFTWDIFLFGAPADAEEGVNLSGLTDLNQFASPDGLMFDERGILWVQTDNGASEVTKSTNDQMLAVIPSALVDAGGNQQVISGTNQTELRRFLVGPNGSEITGLAFTGNHHTFFVNVQHPDNWPYGDDAQEQTPAGVTIRPRSATVVVEKVQGGPVGE
ncbi:PhoX family phosphatase [Saccharophagus sp. K07]|uniref:PhoX family protein n=1 Tax=Saccharophagus sp. K07 TaxID=2283636 RepID=UPI0016522168|nr:PhoX family phosphatase [Saccharophagus sp. K07]MBC6904454.1 PhoX family phosphatase [Saccharophagus sp. K07]